MAITSKGYQGQIDYSDWAEITSRLGGTYGIFGSAGAFAASNGPGDREVVIAPGPAGGAGIIDISDAPITVAGAPVSSGSRWDMIVLRREWGAVNETSVQIKTGTPAKTLPSRDVGPGSLDEQPLWLVRFAAGQTAPQEYVDLRVWQGDGGYFANDLLVRQYMTRIGTEIRIGDVTWRRDIVNGVATWTDFALSYSKLTGDPDFNASAITKGRFDPERIKHLRPSTLGGIVLGTNGDVPGSSVAGTAWMRLRPDSATDLLSVALAGSVKVRFDQNGILRAGAVPSANLDGVWFVNTDSITIPGNMAREFRWIVPEDTSPGSYNVLTQMTYAGMRVRIVRSGNTILFRVENPESEMRTGTLMGLIIRRGETAPLIDMGTYVPL